MRSIRRVALSCQIRGTSERLSICSISASKHWRRLPPALLLAGDSPTAQYPCDEMLEHIREIAAVASVPLNADFLSGFAQDAEEVAINVARCIATGVAGFSIEDSTGDRAHPLFGKDLALSRIKAARESIDASGVGVLLTGRCEAFLVEQPEPLAFALDRLISYSDAGADCLYAPGLSKPEEIAAVVQAVAPKPVNVLVSGFNSHLSLAQLADLGVRRISVGSGLALAAWGQFTRAARERPRERSLREPRRWRGFR